MLAEGLRAHRGPLSASLMAVYGLNLDTAMAGLYRDIRGWMLADLVAGLPAGCAFWQSVGGPMAWSEQVHMMHVLELRFRELMHQNAGKKGAQRPEPVKPPPYAFEAEAAKAKIEDRARRFRERFG